MATDGLVSPSPAPGWYGDPANSANARWWDGARWTDQVRFATPELHYLEPIVLPQAVAEQASPAERAYVPFQHEREVAATAKPYGVSYSAAGWWLSAQPLWTAAVVGVLLGVFSVFGMKVGALSILSFLGVFVASWLIGLGLAIGDAHALVKGGNGGSASGFWALATAPVYLVLRGREIAAWDDSPWGALIWWIVAAVLSPVFAAVAYFALLGIVP